MLRVVFAIGSTLGWPLEKLYWLADVILRWFVRHIWVPSANILTGLRVVLGFIIAGVLLSSDPDKYLVALTIFLTASFLDLIDGPIARERGQVSRFGEAFDRIADKIYICLALPIAFSVYPRLTTVIISFELLSIVSIQVANKLEKDIHPIWAGKFKLHCQIAGVVMILASKSKIFSPELSVILIAHARWMFGAIIALGAISLIYHGYQLFKQKA